MAQAWTGRLAYFRSHRNDEHIGALFEEATRYFGLRLEGTEHIPGVGPVVIVPNHQTYADPVLVTIPIRRRRCASPGCRRFERQGVAMMPPIPRAAPPVFVAALLAAVAVVAAAATDSKPAQARHAELCVACHVRIVGGDGTAIYTRKERKIASLAALRQRVAFCSVQTNAGLFPEDEAAIAAYLNEMYYKFK
jgi:hypothetical protein